MTFRLTCSLLFLILALPLCGITSFARSESVFVGDSIPSRITIDRDSTIVGSEQIRLNGRLLLAGVDYRLDSLLGDVILTDTLFTSDDTLTVTSAPLPDWLRNWYGREIPQTASIVRGRAEQPESFSVPAIDRSGARRVNLAGTQGIQFSTRSAGTSEFSQSLNLTLSGNLSDDVEISGVVADRGFSPGYGTFNSRVNELDKINLEVRSPRVNAQLGDISLGGLANQRTEKRVSGASVAVSFPRWNIAAAAARPKGRFETVRFQGRDNDQGPYLVTAALGGMAIVPGSESVWLDGQKLQRGGDKDYVMEYATGRITFQVTTPIDARSRIEIDFEPLLSDYDGELFAGSAGYNMADSTVFFSVGLVREGDDKERPQQGQFSTGEQAALAAAGDSIPLVSGVTPDTAGAYVLVTDSLPDSVYQYVGPGAGDFRVAFSFLGPGKGSYVFLGGDNYRFEGTGSGEYEPVRALRPPRRTDYLQTIAGFSGDVAGTFTADWRQSMTDRNLLSELDDDNNAAGYLNLAYERLLSKSGRGRIAGRFRVIDSDFQTRERLNGADFERRFYFPRGFAPSEPERLAEGEITSGTYRGVTFHGEFARLTYRGELRSNRGGIGVDFQPAGFVSTIIDYRRTETETNDTVSGEGFVDNVTASANVKLSSSWFTRLRFELDNRKNDYRKTAAGTRYNDADLAVGSRSERLQWQYRNEDSLSGGWSRILERHRLQFLSNREFGRLSYQTAITYQWLDFLAGSENSLLARLGYQYRDRKSRTHLSGTWTVSEEVRNALGINYLEVEPGTGDFIQEDGQLVPDPDGNFIQVEEILSNASRVRRSGKTFLFSRTVGPVSFRLNSSIEEELLDEGERDLLWVLPFYSDASQPYQLFRRRYSGEVRSFPVRGFHIVTLSLEESLEQRRITGSDPQRKDRQADLVIRQVVRQTFLEQSASLFSFRRDAYFSGAGDVSGFGLGLGVRQRFAPGELGVRGSYRRADDTDGSRSRLYSAQLTGRWHVISRGEARTSIELYHQELTQTGSFVSYQLTDNRPGSDGVIWNVTFNYGLKNSVRVNVNVTGRHSDKRTARIFARGEILAGF